MAQMKHCQDEMAFKGILFYSVIAIVCQITSTATTIVNGTKFSLPTGSIHKFGLIIDKFSQQVSTSMGYIYIWDDGVAFKMTLRKIDHTEIATVPLTYAASGRMSDIKMDRMIAAADLAGVSFLNFRDFSIRSSTADIVAINTPIQAPDTFAGMPAATFYGYAVCPLTANGKIALFSNGLLNPLYADVGPLATPPDFEFSVSPYEGLFIVATATQLYSYVDNDPLQVGLIHTIAGGIIKRLWDAYIPPQEEDRFDTFTFKTDFPVYAAISDSGTKLERYWFKKPTAGGLVTFDATKSKSYLFPLGTPFLLAVRRQRRFLWVLDDTSNIYIFNEESFALLSTIPLAANLLTASPVSLVSPAPVDFGVYAPTKSLKLEFWVAVNTAAGGHVVRGDFSCPTSSTIGVCSVCATDNTCLKCGFPYVLISDAATGVISCGEYSTVGMYEIPNTDLYGMCIVTDCIEYTESYTLLYDDKNFTVSNCNNLVCSKCQEDKVATIVMNNGGVSAKVVCLPRSYSISAVRVDDPPERLGTMDLFFEVKAVLMDSSQTDVGYIQASDGQNMKRMSYPNTVDMWKQIAGSCYYTISTPDESETFPNITVRTFPYSPTTGYIGININDLEGVTSNLKLKFQFISVVSQKLALSGAAEFAKLFAPAQNITYMFSRSDIDERNKRMDAGHFLGLLYNHFSLSFASNMYQSAVALGIFVAFNLTSAIPVLCTLAIFCCMKLLYVFHNDQMRAFFNEIRAPTMLLASLYDNADFSTSVNGSPDYTQQLYRSASNKVTTMQVEKSAFFSLYIKGFAMMYLTYSFYLYRYQGRKKDAEEPELILYQASLMRRAESYAMKMFLPDFLLCGLYMLSNLYSNTYVGYIDWSGYVLFSGR